MNIGVGITVKGQLLEMSGKTVVMNKRILDRFKNWIPFFKTQEPLMRKNFTSVWTWGQSNWAPLSRDYLDWKRKAGYSSKKNVRTGRMKDAMVSGQLNVQTEQTWRWGIDGASSQWWEGGNKPYPVYAAERRNFVLLMPDAIRNLIENWKKYIMKLMGK